ncbi:MAG TPA: 6-phospho-beta-glucosidase [Desulfomonilia bacterium]
MKICIIGGGSTYTPELIEGLIKISEHVRIREICLLDIPESERKLEILSGFSDRILKAAGSRAKLLSTYNAEEAISGADFILNQFRAGCMRGRINDEKIPLGYGLIGQETTGMGGMANGLRAMPIMEKYTSLAKKFSNNAWMINFTNPSGMMTEFIVNYLGYEKCIGLCNCPIEFVLQACIVLGCQENELLLRYYGLNHLAWVDGVFVSGKDRTSEVLENIRVNMKNIPDLEYGDNFIPMLGMLPNPYLRYFYNTSQMLKSQMEAKGKQGTRGEEILVIEEELLGLYSEPERTRPPEELSKRGGFMYSTVATELIKSIATNDGRTHIINTRNSGTIDDFPDDYIMEIPAKLTSYGPVAIPLGKAAKPTVGLISTIKNYERLTIEGHLAKDENLVKQAMLVHPLGPEEKDIDQLWNDLKAANKDYFTDFGQPPSV